MSISKGMSAKQKTKMSGKKNYTKESLAQAVEEVAAGASMKTFGIPHITLQDYHKNKYSHNPHPNAALTPEK